MVNATADTNYDAYNHSSWGALQLPAECSRSQATLPNITKSILDMMMICYCSMRQLIVIYRAQTMRGSMNSLTIAVH